MKKDYLKLTYYMFGFITSIIVIVMLVIKSNSEISTQSEVYYLAIGIAAGFFIKRSIDFFIKFYKMQFLKTT